jgi:hypothetical protein
MSRLSVIVMSMIVIGAVGALCIDTVDASTWQNYHNVNAGFDVNGWQLYHTATSDFNSRQSEWQSYQKITTSFRYAYDGIGTIGDVEVIIAMIIILIPSALLGYFLGPIGGIISMGIMSTLILSTQPSFLMPCGLIWGVIVSYLWRRSR